MLGRECTKDGKTYAFIAMAQTTQEPNKCIFEPASPISREMLEKYDDVSVSKMRSHVFRCEDGVSCLVDNQSPLSRMMRLNQKALNMTIGPDEKWEGHLKVWTKAFALVPMADSVLRWPPRSWTRAFRGTRPTQSSRSRT